MGVILLAARMRMGTETKMRREPVKELSRNRVSDRRRNHSYSNRNGRLSCSLRLKQIGHSYNSYPHVWFIIENTQNVAFHDVMIDLPAMYERSEQLSKRTANY